MLNIEKATTGQKLDLTKGNQGLTEIKLGLGWDAGDNYDLDGFAVLVDENNKILGPFTANNNEAVCYFGKLRLPGVSHSGDNLTGEGEGDDEVLTIKFAELDPRVKSVMLFANIYQATERNQNFGKVKNAFIRIFDQGGKPVNAEGKTEIRYDLSEDFSSDTAVEFGRVYQHNGEWKFEAVGKGFKGDINSIANSFC